MSTTADANTTTNALLAYSALFADADRWLADRYAEDAVTLPTQEEETALIAAWLEAHPDCGPDLEAAYARDNLDRVRRRFDPTGTEGDIQGNYPLALLPNGTPVLLAPDGGLYDVIQWLATDGADYFVDGWGAATGWHADTDDPHAGVPFGARPLTYPDGTCVVTWPGTDTPRDGGWRAEHLTWLTPMPA